MPGENDVTQTDHPQRNKQNEDERLMPNARAGSTQQGRHLVVEPPICDEQEWHRF